MKFHHNRFNYLLVVLVLVYGGLFIATDTNLKFPYISFIYLSAMLSVVSLFVGKSTRIFFVLVALGAFIPEILYKGDFFIKADYRHITISLVMQLMFLFLTIIVFLRELYREKEITSDAIKGGICVYILLGFFWGFVYELISRYDSATFNIILKEGRDFFYFSFITLMTVGYGDINPLSPVARFLSSFEAMSGQLFLAIFIARLVGLQISRELRKK